MSTTSLEIETSSTQESLALGKKLGAYLKAGDCIALSGDLGSGKTVISKGIAEGLDCQDEVVSPTFNLLLEYKARIPIRHLDAYFAEKQEHFLEEALEEVFSPDGISLIEWAERIQSLLPPQRLEIQIRSLGEERRRFLITGQGKRGQELMELLRQKK